MCGLLLAASGTVLFSACSSGTDSTGGQSGGPSDEFAVLGSSIVDGSTWKLNRAIEVEFTQDVDFSTVSGSTIQIVDAQGTPAIGSFSLPSPRVVRFQPKCPTNDTNSDGGLLQGRDYRLSVLSQSSAGVGGGLTIASTQGDRLEQGLNVSFETPESNDPLVLFVDVVSGPPQVRVRGLNGESLDSDAASYVEIGGDADPESRRFFTFVPMNQQGEIEGDVPLNLYSNPDEQFSVVLRFNQPIFASTLNVNSDLLRLEYLNASSGSWERVPATVSLIANCTATGASVRISPTGIVPQGAAMRINLREGFRDLTGDRVQSSQTSFARFNSTVANPTGATPAERSQGSDEILERFTVGGDLPGSLEDTTIASAQPRADWANSNAPGALAASFNFGGTGGINGTFDLLVDTGDTLFINTDSDTVNGGPDVLLGGSASASQPVINGLLQVRNLEVRSGAKLIFLGPNTAEIFATGTIRIFGEISVNGGDNFGVGTLNTTNQPEEGAAGQAGGGSGGQGSFLTSQSTPQGGRGNGAFDVPGLGGEGGESGFSAVTGTCRKEFRRGGGGGGGVLSSTPIRYAAVMGQTNLAICQMKIGMDAEPGFIGSLDGTGAISGSEPPRGGDIAPSPFLDASPRNDFFGNMLTSSGEQIRGELSRVWAGSGGGGGGDAVQSATFPLTPFSAAGDEKGAGGGGGAGGLLMLAIGNIEVLGTGEVSANGGHGGGGENVIFFDRIGGGSGGGSGGHIVMSSASSIIIESEATTAATGDFYRDDTGIQGAFHADRPLRALGGQGGAGRKDECGADNDGERTWRKDAIPTAAFEGRTDIPPLGPTLQNQFSICNDVESCATAPEEGIALGAGGDGGPGIIQLHVADPATQLQFPNAIGGLDYLEGLDVTRSMSPPPFGWTTPESTPDVLIPFFSSRSEAFSRWIPLGLARVNEDGTTNPVEFFFGGTDTADGSLERDNSVAAELMPIVDYTALSQGGAAPSVSPAEASIVIPGAQLADPNDLYKRNARLLREFAVRIRETGSAVENEFTVATASYDVATDEYTLVVDPRGTAFADLFLSLGAPEVEVVPFYFRMLTAGVQDSFPLGSNAFVSFDATVANPVTGEPSSDPTEAYSGMIADILTGAVNGFATDINDLNTATTNTTEGWDFVRFKVLFDLDSNLTGVDLDSPRPGLDFLRIPYRF